MAEIEEFIGKFTDKKVKYQMVKNKFYLPGKNEVDQDPLYMTTFLGEMKGQKFKPSVALLDILASKTNRTVIVNDKSAWLFLCKKNVLKEGIVKKNVEDGVVLVLNERKEVLGYGKITGSGITNLLDRGDFLRRER